MKKKIEAVMPSGGALLRIAKRISGEAKRAEDPVAWRESRVAECYELLELAQQEKEDSWPLILEATQGLRDAGVINPDVALAVISLAVVHIDKENVRNDPVMKQIGLKINAIREREGLTEHSDTWELHDPKTPEDYKVLAWQAFNHTICVKLRQHGEGEIADVLRNDHDSFKRRFKEGLLQFFKDDPEVRLDDEFFREVFA